MSKRGRQKRRERESQRRREVKPDLASSRPPASSRAPRGDASDGASDRRPRPVAGSGPGQPLVVGEADRVMQPLLLTVEQAAAMLSVSRATFYRLGQPGKVTLPTGAVRYRASELQAYVDGLDVRRN